MPIQRWCSSFKILLLAILYLCPLPQALPLDSPLISRRQSQTQSQSSSQETHKGPHPNWGCPFPGNSDLYGLGIRLGVYLQLLSTLLANALLSDALREDARNTNAIISK